MIASSLIFSILISTICQISTTPIMPRLAPTLKLNDGHSMPIVGLGTLGSVESGDRLKIYQAVRDAISVGYRHIDTAAIYEVEDVVGKAVRDAIAEGNVTREEMFITTKLWPKGIKFDQVITAAKKSLTLLGLDYVDLYLVHWPFGFVNVGDEWHPRDDEGKLLFDDETNLYEETWKAVEELKRTGLTKSIGVSNFNSQQIAKLVESATIKPAVNQVEGHPFLSQTKLRDFCASKQIVLTAYGPLGVTQSPSADVPDEIRVGLLANPLIKKLADKYGKSTGQILLKFQVQRGISVIPKSVNKQRIASNIDLFDFEFDSDEIKELEALNRNFRFYNGEGYKDSKNFPFNIEF